MKHFILLTILTFSFCTSLFASIKVSQHNWRWHNNNGSETSATWKAEQNTPITIGSIDSILRLRVQVVSNGDGLDRGVNTTLQYASAPNGPWNYVTNFKGNNAFMYSSKNVFLGDTSLTTKQFAAQGLAFIPGRVLVKTNEFDIPFTVNSATEVEYSLLCTDNISPSTTYYFRLSGMDSANLASLTTSSTINTKPKLLSNGSFENGLQDWTFDAGSSTGAFLSIVDSGYAEGTKAAFFRLNLKGTSSLTHAPVQFTPGKVYMVHFFANTKKDGGKMRLLVKGQGKTLTYDFALNNTGMNEYEFAFKAVDASAALVFLLQDNTQYVLDDLQVWDEDNEGIDVPMNYMWQNNRPENEYSWLSADGENSQLLPDGRVVWNFSDGWYGYNDTSTNSMNTHQLLRNTLVEQTEPTPNGILHTHQGGTPDHPDALMKPPFDPQYKDNFFWPRDMITENDSLKVLLPQVVQKTNSAPLSDGHQQAIGVVSLPDLTVRSIKYMPWLDSAYTYYCALCQADDGYTYAYGSDSDGNHVARFPTGQLNTTTPWMFLHDTGWNYNYYDSKVISDFSLFSVTRLGPGNYVAIGKPLGFSDHVEAVFAQSPIGPWIGKNIVVSRVPPELRRSVVLNYFPVIHEETEKDGVYTISFNNIGDIGQMLKDKRLYWPTFFKADLKSLSPFTDAILPVTYLEFTAKAESKKVLLQWKTVTETNNDRFEIERSADGRSNWKAVASVKSKGNSLEAQSYSTYDAHPLNGDNYYRLKQVDRDGKFSLSEVRLVTMQLTKAVLSVYPNPTKGAINFTLSNYSGSNITVKLTDINGNPVHTETITVNSANTYKLTITNKLAAGAYILQLTGEQIKETAKVVVQ